MLIPLVKGVGGCSVWHALKKIDIPLTPFIRGIVVCLKYK